MDTAIEARMLDLVDWLRKRERTCDEVTRIWLGADSKVAIWKKAVHCGYVMTEIVDGRCTVRPTSLALVEGELTRQVGNWKMNCD